MGVLGTVYIIIDKMASCIILALMARLARVVIPGVPHHVTQRGNRRQATFFSDSDYQEYLGLLVDGCDKAGTDILAYCLMPNHVHLLLVPNCEDGLRQAIAETHRRYTRMINFREQWKGHLWQERFASFPTDETYQLAVARYIELNPVRAGLASLPQEYRWSSARAHLSVKSDGIVNPASLLRLIPDWNAFLAAGDSGPLHDTIRQHENTGRPLASEDFITRAESLLKRNLLPKKPGPKPKTLN